MVTVPDDLHRQDTWVIVDFDQSFKRPLNFLVLLVHVVGSDLPVGFGSGQIGLMNPRATLVAKIPMHVVSGPACHSQNGESLTVLQPAISSHI